EELTRGDPALLRQTNGDAGNRALRLERKDEKPFLLQLVTESGFGLGRVDALDDLSRGRREAAPELHLGERPAIDCQDRHYRPEIIATPRHFVVAGFSRPSPPDRRRERLRHVSPKRSGGRVTRVRPTFGAKGGQRQA